MMRIELLGGSTSQYNVLIGVVGSGTIALDGAQQMILVAPDADITLPSVSEPQRHKGGFYGKSIIVHQDSTVEGHPFERADCSVADDGLGSAFGCDPIDSDDDGLSDCVESASGADPNQFNGVRIDWVGIDGALSVEDFGNSIRSAQEFFGSAEPIDSVLAKGGLRFSGARSTNPCSYEYGIDPPFAACSNQLLHDHQILGFRGLIQLPSEGESCWRIRGSASNALVFIGSTPIAVGGEVQCLQQTPATVDLEGFAGTGPWGQIGDLFDNAVSIELCDSIVCDSYVPLGIPDFPRGPFIPLLPPCDENSECSAFCPCSAEECDDDNDCLDGQVCGEDNGEFFGKAPGTSVCWDPICETSQSSYCSPSGGTSTALCGRCACTPNCEGKQCGDDPGDGCGGVCPGLCNEGEAGCSSSLDCPSGTECAGGVGPRFGFPSGTNVCWNIRECAIQDPTLPNCGVDPDKCGVCAACVPQCDGNSDGPDGCGGYCGACPEGENRMPNGQCTEVTTTLLTGDDYPVPLNPIQTFEAGAVPGSFQVTDQGTAEYSIPIEVPPGRAGLQPSLTLNYASTKDNGMLGMGWSLGGLSSIERCPAIADRDVFARDVKLDERDWFCLDGKPLVLIPGSDVPYGAEGAEYSTEIDSFVRVVSHEGVDVSGPAWFEVFSKDGRIMTYGLRENSSVFTHNEPDVDAKLKRTWALDSVRDRSGNLLEVKYKQRASIEVSSAERSNDEIASSGELIPDVISYGGALPNADAPDGVPHSRFVKFHSEERPDPRRHFVQGSSAFSTERLRNIETYVFDQMVNIYWVGYDSQRSDDESRVASVTLCGPYGDYCLAPTTFELHGGSGDYDAIDPPPVSDQPSVTRDIVIPIDADGDGRDELLYLYISGGDGPSLFNLMRPDTGDIVPTALLRDPGVRPSDRSAPYDDTECINESSIMDVNRDGKEDLVDLCPTDNGSVRAFISNGVTFHEETIDDVFLTAADKLFLADLDGNGLKDMATCRRKTSDPDEMQIWQTFLNLGDRFFNVQTSFDVLGVRGKCSDLSVLDIDGDGADEIVQPLSAASRPARISSDPDRSTRVVKVLDMQLVGDEPAGPLIDFRWTDWGEAPILTPSLGTPVTFWWADFNGDGLSDLLYYYHGTNWIALNQGSPRLDGDVPIAGGFTGTHFVAEGLGYPNQYTRVVDYDGDGLDDLIAGNTVFRSPGLGLAEQIEIPGSPVEGDIGAVGDVNGDGSLDLIPRAWSDGGLTAGAHILLGRQALEGLVRQITDGNGKQIRVEYGLDGFPFGESPYDGSGCVSDNETFRNTCLRTVAPLVVGNHLKPRESEQVGLAA